MNKQLGLTLVGLSLLLVACTDTPEYSLQERNYQQSRAVFWRNLYPHDGQTLYCRQAFNTDQRQGINIEHVFPMAWVTKALDCGKRNQCRDRSDLFNAIEADLHNLYPSRSDVNKDRAAFRFGEVPGERRVYGQDCDFETNARSRVAEPTPEVRGEIARAMFYMAHRYRDHGLVIFRKQAQMLLQWHQQDPPGAAERRRNDIIQKLQGSRNPFIDTPELLDELMAQGAFD